MLDHEFPTVADDDHHVLGFKVSRGFDDVSDKGPSSDRMEDFRHGGLHPRALTGGQDDDDPGASAHEPSLVHPWISPPPGSLLCPIGVLPRATTPGSAAGEPRARPRYAPRLCLHAAWWPIATRTCSPGPWPGAVTTGGGIRSPDSTRLTNEPRSFFIELLLDQPPASAARLRFWGSCHRIVRPGSVRHTGCSTPAAGALSPRSCTTTSLSDDCSFDTQPPGCADR